MSKHLENVQILAVVGLAGAGKSEVVDYITKHHIPKVYAGGVLYAAMDEAGIEITPESQAQFRKEIREKEGNDFVFKRVLKQVNDLIDAGQKRVLIDGLYSWTEYKMTLHEFPGKVDLLAVVAPRRLRYHRLEHRPSRPFTREEAQARDWSEIENLEKGGPIAIADHFIINDGNLADLHSAVDSILDKTNFLA